MPTPTTEQRLIRYLVEHTVDYDAIGRQLAKDNPELFMGIVEGTLDVQFTRRKYGMVLDLIREGNVVIIIKALRDITGLGLKEAKDVVDFVIGNALALSLECRVPPERIHGYIDNIETARESVVNAGNEKLANDLLAAYKS